jgi:GTP pyrophosphokinase
LGDCPQVSANGLQPSSTHSGKPSPRFVRLSGGDADARNEEIDEQFGRAAADIVLACTDSTEPKPPWRQRKEDYLAHLPSVSPDALLVSVADKVHNSRSILMDLHSGGVAMFERFTGGMDGTLWYYRSLVSTYRSIEGFDSRLIDELDRNVTAIGSLAEPG